MTDFFENQPNARDLPAGDPERILAEECGRLFSTYVNALRQDPPTSNPTLNGLMGLVWDLVGSGTIPTCLAPEVKVIHFSALHDNVSDNVFGFVTIPPAWPELVRRDPVMQMGAVVWVGSQIVDFYNGKIPHTDGPAAVWAGPDAESAFRIEARAKMYESELYHLVQEKESGWRPNAYQKRVMKAFPGGVRSPRAVSEGLVYASKAYN